MDQIDILSRVPIHNDTSIIVHIYKTQIFPLQIRALDVCVS